MSCYIKIPAAVLKFACNCKKQKMMFVRVVDASDHFTSDEYPFILQYRCKVSSNWCDLCRYSCMCEARDAMMRIFDRYKFVMLE